MKKFLFLLAFLTAGAMTTTYAQTEKKACSKSASKKCCAKKASATAATKSECTKTKTTTATVSTMEAKHAPEKSETAVAGVIMAADEAAAQDKTIEKRICEKSGKVCYYKKTECPVTGKVSHEQVEYSVEEGKFVNMAPSDAMPTEKSSCSKKSAKVVKTSMKE